MQVNTSLSDYGIQQESSGKLLTQLAQHGMIKLGEKQKHHSAGQPHNTRA